MKLLLAVSSLASIITFSPVVYQAGVISSAKLLATKSPLDYDSINVYTDLRLLYGDSNDDGIIDDNEYYNFDYKILIKAADESQSIYEDFYLLTYVPVHNDIYFYFYSTLQLEKNNLQVSYSDSQILNENSSLGYVENNHVKDLTYINKYNVENGYFYKFKLENFSSNTNTESQNRIRIFEFITLWGMTFIILIVIKISLSDYFSKIIESTMFTYGIVIFFLLFFTNLIIFINHAFNLDFIKVSKEEKINRERRKKNVKDQNANSNAWKRL